MSFLQSLTAEEKAVDGIFDASHNYLVLHYFMFVFRLLVVLTRLSVPVQVIDWKDLFLKLPVTCLWGC